MRKQVIAVAVAFAFTFAAGAGAQQSAQQAPGSKGQMVEAVVIVTNVDVARRTVQVRTPKGQTVVSVPPDTDLEQIQVGTRYRVRYSEPLAMAIEPGAQAPAAGGATASVEPRSGAAGAGEGVKTDQVAGVVEQIDTAGRQIVLRSADGGKQAYRIGEGVAQGSLKTGDAVTLTYQQAVATQMVSTPQPIRDPAPAQ
jgi:hypothetical protein